MELIESNGSFLKYFAIFKENLSENEINDFNNLESDFDRFTYISNLNAAENNIINIKKDFTGKNVEQSLILKEKGNEAFKNMRWLEAATWYSKSYIAMPCSNTKDLSIVLANRSAALFHMEKYNKSLQDIDRAFAYVYPNKIQWKLYERQARCYLALKKHKEAVESFKKTISSLDFAEMPMEKRLKLETDAKIMIQMIEKNNILPKTKAKADVKSDDNKFLNKAIDFDYNEIEGRFAKSNRRIEAGEKLIIEKPYGFALLEKYSKTHCQQCLKRVKIPIACPACISVIFCSEICCNEAITTYHKYECGILPSIWRSGASLNCHIALRIIAQNNLNYFINSKNILNNLPSLTKILKLPCTNYEKIYHLTTHKNIRSKSSFLQYTLMAHFLTRCLKEGGYFDSSTKTEDIFYIGSLVLHNLQFLQFNTHEVYELQQSKSPNNIKTVFIGGAVYPTLALFNHSCDPNIVRYYDGSIVHVHAIRPIECNEAVHENYGPLFTQEEKENRQRKLKELYWFDCVCRACSYDWPIYNNMNNENIRFRCDSEEPCDNVLLVPPQTNDFMIKCYTCGQFTNILKGLKVMQDTEMMKKTANQLYQAGNFKEALKKYIDIIKIIYEVLAPPFTDFYDCQQNVKDCFLHFGSIYNQQ